MNRFISCDWGTSRFRLRLVEGDPLRIASEHTTDEGVQSLAAGHTAGEGRHALLEKVLERGLAALGLSDQPDLPIVMSGMASSTLGWQLLPYAHLPAPIDGRTLRFTDFRHGGRKIRLISGLQSTSDVMRGEEVELVGIMADPARRARAEKSVIILPGSHSKHVRVHTGQIVGFTTYLTGELYGLLAQNSTLATPSDQLFDPASFVAGLQASQAHGLSAALFQTRARVVLGQLAAAHSRSFLSGVLIGAEVATLTGMSAGHIVLATGESLARPYALALRELMPNASVEQLTPAQLSLAMVRGHATILDY
ncbi:MAG TPA: 2-dehydro-3-deoxygalactonokinase [Lacunisphaera sp.]